MGVNSAHVRSGNSQNRMFNRNAGAVFGPFNRLLNGADCFFQIHNDALARTARVGEAMAAVAQSVVGKLRHEHAGLCAADINRGQELFIRLGHR